MDIFKVNVSELTDIEEVKRIYKLAAIDLETTLDDLLFEEGINYEFAYEKVNYLKGLVKKLRIRIYELEEPEFSDGTIDLYRDHGTHFTITEHTKKIPIGIIEYSDTKNPVPGNISYEIEKEYRGHHYALRALRIIGRRLLEVGVTNIIITANDNKNFPSMRTIEQFGGTIQDPIDKTSSGPIPYKCDLEKIYSK